MTLKERMLYAMIAMLPAWVTSLYLHHAIIYVGVTLILFFLTRVVIFGLVRTRKETVLLGGLLAWLVVSVSLAYHFLRVSPLCGVSLWLLLKPRLTLLLSEGIKKRRKRLKIYLVPLQDEIALLLLFSGLFVGMAGIRYLINSEFNFALSNHPSFYFVLLFIVIWSAQAFEREPKKARRRKRRRL